MLVDKHYRYKKHIQRLDGALRDMVGLYEANEDDYIQFALHEERVLAKAHASLKMTEKHYND